MKYIYTRISGPYGPWNSSPCRGLPRFARKNVRSAHIPYSYHHHKKNVCPPPLCVKNVCPRGTNNLFVPGGQTFLTHSWGGGGTKILFAPGGQKISLTHQRGGGDKHFSIIMMMIENVSEANILSSEARKLPAGAKISRPVGP